MTDQKPVLDQEEQDDLIRALGLSGHGSNHMRDVLSQDEIESFIRNMCTSDEFKDIIDNSVRKLWTNVRFDKNNKEVPLSLQEVKDLLKSNNIDNVNVNYNQLQNDSLSHTIQNLAQLFNYVFDEIKNYLKFESSIEELPNEDVYYDILHSKIDFLNKILHKIHTSKIEKQNINQMLLMQELEDKV